MWAVVAANNAGQHGLAFRGDSQAWVVSLNFGRAVECGGFKSATRLPAALCALAAFLVLKFLVKLQVHRFFLRGFVE